MFGFTTDLGEAQPRRATAHHSCAGIPAPRRILELGTVGQKGGNHLRHE